MSSTATEQNTFTRPSFIVSAVVVGVVAVIGVVLGIGALTDNGNATNPPAAGAPTSQPAPSESSDSDGSGLSPVPGVSDSVCDLPGSTDQGTVTAPPQDASWDFIGLIAAPQSESAGPGEVTETGLRYCFAHTPEGALLTAANAAVQGSTPEIQQEFAEYFLAAGPGREAALSEGRATTDSGPTAGRLSIVGFRMLEYTGDTALVDIALQYSEGATVAIASAVTPLKWEDGDWKMVVSDDGEAQYPVAVVPNLAGYISWSAA